MEDIRLLAGAGLRGLRVAESASLNLGEKGMRLILQRVSGGVWVGDGKVVTTYINRGLSFLACVRAPCTG